MAVVYRATQLSLDRVVALKVIAPELGDDPSFRARFKREGQLQAAMDHEHIVPVHEAGESEHGLFLAMRLIAGPTLKDLILSGQLDPRRSVRLLAQVAQALDVAHQAGLIHRDVKPQNILIDRNDHVYLADFGLTKALDDTTRLTGTGQFLGTIDYVAPEQIQGEPPIAASDCYSLTAVLYECLAGQVPFPGHNEAAVLHAHVVKPPPRITEVRPELPAAMDEVIAVGMAKDPGARPSSATKLLRAAAQALASTSPQPSSRAQPTRHGPLPDGGGGTQTTRVPDARAAVTARGSPALEVPAGATRLAQTAAAPPPPGAVAAEVAVGPTSAEPRISAGALTGLIGALAAIAIAGGFLLGHSGTKAVSARFTNSATVGHLQLRYPSGWQVGAGLPAVPGMSFNEPLVLGPTPSLYGLTAGEIADAEGPTLLAASFRGRLGGALPPGDPVKLGGLDAYRYERLHVRGLNGTLTVYAAPTSAGVATLACWDAASAAPAGQAECGRVAATLRLAGAKSYPLGPDAGYASLLSAALTRLHAATSSPLARLPAASSASGQAQAEQRLAMAFSKAAVDLSGAVVSPMVREVHNALTGALRQIASGYSRAAVAAHSGNAGAYRSAGQEVVAGSTAFTRALRGLSGLGYTVGT
ncbi:MAG: serine/threonine protein kinase [Solirubrobacterales bacterium]|nr:serine/threonine protein kinase [Solirubrobacterales bacterium]